MFFDRFRKKNKEEIKKEIIKTGKFDQLRKEIDILAKERIDFYSNSNCSKEELKKYVEVMNATLNDLDRFINSYEEAEIKASEITNMDSEAYKYVIKQKQRWHYAIVECTKQIGFMRPNNKIEQEKRKEIYLNFSNDVVNLLGSDSELRFHGTPIYYAKDIIRTKSLSGSADRFDGYIKSTDIKGEFSASDISSLDRTIHFFTDFSSDTRCLPCGVLFVLKEKENDEELRKYSTMHNIDFDKNPEQLQAIICTEENIENINKWCIESNIDPNLVYTYDSYVEHLRNIKKL